jgi:hypothetical protein
MTESILLQLQTQLCSSFNKCLMIHVSFTMTNSCCLGKVLCLAARHKVGPTSSQSLLEARSHSTSTVHTRAANLPSKSP